MAIVPMLGLCVGRSVNPQLHPYMKAPAKNDSKPTKETKPEKKAPAIDGIGNRVGSQAARINAAMSKEPRTVEAIAAAAKLGVPRVRSHMAYLIKRKAAVQTQDGFALK